MKAGVDIWAGTSANTFRSYVARLKELGVEYIRLEFGNAFLSNLRTLVPVVISNGFKVLGLLMEKSFAPSNVPGWASWVTGVVNEFKGNVHVWECWNEPNQANTFFNGGTAEQYTEFLKACYTAAKTVDLSCMILGGSIAFTNDGALNYWRTIYENGGKDYMDEPCSHPYCSPFAPDDTVNTPNPYIYLTKVREIMESYGDNRNLWITELGWSSSGGGIPPITEQLQADYTVKALTLAYQWGWVDGYILYRWKDSTGTPNGLNTTAMVPKLAFYAVKDFIWNYIPPPPPPPPVQYVLDVWAALGGTTTPTGIQTVLPGTVISIMATKAQGYKFGGWQVQTGMLQALTDYPDTVNPLVLTITAATTVMPLFSLVPVPPTCPAGTHWDATINACVQDTPSQNNLAAGAVIGTLVVAGVLYVASRKKR